MSVRDFAETGSTGYLAPHFVVNVLYSMRSMSSMQHSLSFKVRQPGEFCKNNSSYLLRPTLLRPSKVSPCMPQSKRQVPEGEAEDHKRRRLDLGHVNAGL